MPELLLQVNVSLMLDHCLRRFTNTNPTLCLKVSPVISAPINAKKNTRWWANTHIRLCQGRSRRIRWDSVKDGGPTLSQHQSYMLAYHCSISLLSTTCICTDIYRSGRRLWRWPIIEQALCGSVSKHGALASADWMLGQRRRRWSSNEAALGY